MRRVDSEGESQMGRNRKRAGSRTGPNVKSHLRRLALEGLELRTLLATTSSTLVSTLPTPTTTLDTFVGESESGLGNSSSPSVAIDPLDPTKMVAAWTTYDPNNKIDAGNDGGQVTTYVQGAYSVDGGQTWTELPDDTDADIQTDFSVAAVTSPPQPDFTQTTDATVAFDRNQNAYLLTSTHSGTGGVLDLQRWDFSTASSTVAPVAATFTRPAYDQASGELIPTTLNPIYRWQGGDAAVSPTLAVDDNLASFTDTSVTPSVTQTDAFSGNVYVAWQTVDTAPKNTTINTQSIKLMSSADKGQDFTYQAYLDQPFDTSSEYDTPKIAISQGGNGVKGGLVTVVYDNSDPGNTVAPFFDLIETKSDQAGGTDSHFNSTTDVPIHPASAVGSTTTPATPGITNIPFTVALGSSFTTLQNLTITLSLEHPTLADTSAVLISPTGKTVTLWNNATDDTGTATGAFGTLTGANIGASTLGPFIGTTLDSTALRSLFDGTVAAPYTGHFQPAQSLVTAFKGLTASSLNGTWTLRITEDQGDTATTPRLLIGASLDFTQGLTTTNPNTGAIQNLINSSPSFVAQTFLNSGAHLFTDGIQGVPVLPDPSIASDNTLGVTSPFEGRLYIATADDDFNDVSGAYTTSTFIELYTSDDGGEDWNFAGIVNDDDGLTDGFSTAGYAQPGSVLLASQADPNVEFFGLDDADVRPKIEPEVAVDSYTGTVVVSFLDTRNDAAAVRVSTYIAASTDGGASFAPETYANPSQTAVDAITGATVNLGPIPDNETSGNAASDSTFGFGQRQGLAVADGEIIPVWSSNENTGSNTLGIKDPLFIGSAILNYAAGPRVIASTQGPVGEPGDTVNTTRAADGSPIANTIVITFDRAVNPSSFPSDNGVIGSSPIEVFYNSPTGGTPVPLEVTNVTASDDDTVYTVTFNPLNFGVGTYTYTLRPLVTGMVPFQALLNIIPEVAFIDTAQNTTPSTSTGTSSFTVTGHTGIGLTSAAISAEFDVYLKGTSTGAATDLQVFLETQDGMHQYLLFETTTKNAVANAAVALNASIAIPTTDGEPVDQTYTIKVVENVPGEEAFVFNNVNPADFNFQVQLDAGLTRIISGNALDQNSDGTPGEIPNGTPNSPSDDYSIPDGLNSLPLIVPGPHVVSTTVTGDNNTTVVESIPLIDTAVSGGQSNFAITGNTGVFLNSVTLTGLVTIYQAVPHASGTASDLQIFLVGADGTSFLLFETSTANGSTFAVNVTVPIPTATNPEPFAQTYTLKVVDNVSGEAARLSGTSGGSSSSSLTLVGDSISTGTDNLVNNNNVSSIDVTFDRNMEVSSFTPSQILSVVGPTGRIDGPQTFASTGIAKNYAYNGSYELIPKAVGATPGILTSTVFIQNTGTLKLSNLSVELNITDPNDSSLQIDLVSSVQANGQQIVVPLVLNGTASGANFTNTTFSDTPSANGLTSTIPAGKAPYSLTYSPATPLAALAGLTIQGTWLLVVADSTTGGAQGRLNSWSLNVTPQVPEGTGTSFSSPLVISSYPDNSFKIAHLAVQLNISSTKDSDLEVELVSPTGVTVPLILNDGGTGTNFTNTILDDNGTIPIASGVAPFSLTYKPANPLAAFDGLSINGTWTLKIINPNADGSVTTLNSWSLIATPQLTVTAVNPVGNDATTFAIGFPTQTLSGTYNVTLSPDILSASDDTNPLIELDTNLNAGVDALRGIGTGVTTPVQYAATSVPVAIPYAAQPPTGPLQPGVLTSQLNVADNFAVQGDLDSDTVAGLTVTLNISYYYDPDLTVTLTSPGPNSKTIELFANVGNGGSYSNFTNTTLSDVTNPLAPITAAGAPFFGTFNPESSLAQFSTDSMGNQAFSAGLWTLTITNIGTGTNHPNVPNTILPTLNSWSLTFQKPQVNTGLGEPVADQVTVGFRLFNIAPSDPLANDTWTAVGPAGTSAAANPNNLTGGAATGADLGGPVSVVAIDPSDPSGNTAYIGADSGGIWKTTDFLTTSAAGPTYVPLTDFGSNYTINIGSIAIFDQNSDPSQSVIFAGTGDGESTTANAGNAVEGVGILRSTNGGSSFTLLDSSVNVDANGNPLPENSPLRDHIFVGTTTYKIIVDPVPLPNGGIIVYAALGGPNGGLWRSEDGGNHWTNLSAGVIPQVNGQNATATDVILDPASASNSTGNLDILYAAFENVGVFISTNQGLGLTQLLGNVGADNLIQNAQYAPAKPLTVADAILPTTTGRIVLAKPALTDDAAENILYQDWLYVSVLNPDGTFNGLYVTKDRGENWTKAQIASIPTTGTPTEALPTNDNLQTNNYDVSSSDAISTQNGNADFSMTVDPLNPNIVYLGGTQNYQTSGLIRVDLTGIYDAHSFVPYANNRDDGGKLTDDSVGRINVNIPGDGDPLFYGSTPPPLGQPSANYYLNLRHSPTDIDAFNVSSTQYVFNSNDFTNDGTGVTWTPIDTLYDDPLDGSTNIHQLLTIVDPLTGLTRLIIADDQGVFTGVFNADGTLDTDGIGTDPAVTGSRNGNLQDEELYDSAAQPSSLAAAAAGALFYGSGIGITDAQSSATLLSTGDLTWTVVGTAYGDLQDIIDTNDRGGTGIATDPTGGTTISNPIGTGPSVYEYDVPLLGGDTTNFFRVNNAGQTTGLTTNYQAQFPGNNVLSNGNGVNQLGNFAVNPLNGSQLLISSNTGNVYETTNKGVQWLLIGPSTTFDGTEGSALTYGAPDPNSPNGLGNLDNFIYVGTIGGHIYVSQTGGSPWTSISNGLDGSSIEQIYTNPNRGSHEAYAVTLDGVYYMANSTAANATWVNITGNLTQIQRNAFGDPTQASDSLLGYNAATDTFGGFRAIVADYRYAVPDPVTPTTTYPVLYVSGYGGVYRSIDNGQTWTAFPDTSFDSAPSEGGYLPDVDVTSLSLDLGAINPATGHATQTAGDREVLLASTLGRGDFAIGLAPIVLPNSAALSTTLPSPGGSDSGAAFGDPDVTNVLEPYITGVSEISNFGNSITINIYDETGGPGQGDLIGTGTTTATGSFSVQLTNIAGDPSFFQSSTSIDDKVIGIQATDISGASGNITKFAYTLDTITPSTPVKPVLEPQFDTGRSNTDDITDLSIPAPTPGSGLSIVTPIFDVATTLPPANPLTPYPITLTVELLRSTSPTGPFTVVATAPGGTTSPVKLSDPGLAALAAASQINTPFYYVAEQIDQAGNVSTMSSVLTVTVNTTVPTTLGAPTLVGAAPPYVTSNTSPTFSVTGLSVNDQVFLYRSVNGGTPVLVGEATAPNINTVTDGTVGLIDGIYTYYVAQQDIAGNFSLLSPGTVVTINTQVVPNAPILEATDDTGRFSNDDVTNIAVPAPTPGSTPNFVAPIFDVTTTPAKAGEPATTTVELLRATSQAGPFTIVGTSPYSAINPTKVTDTSLAALAAATQSNTDYYYESQQVDAAGIPSGPSSGILTVDLITIIPTTPVAPTLDPASNSGLNKGLLITNVKNPTFDVTSVASGDNLELFRSVPGTSPAQFIKVGTAAVGALKVTDTSMGGAQPDGVYQYAVAQVDIAGNISPLSPVVTITINTATPAIPTLNLLVADDSGLPSHPNVTNVNTPRFNGTAQYNAGANNFPVAILNVTGLLAANYGSGTVLTTTFPTATGTYQTTALTKALPDGTYTLVAQTTNLAGTVSYSTPLTITIRATGPLASTLTLLPADDTGIKGDGVTANHDPRFTGNTAKADYGDTVTLYAIINGVLSAPEATAVSSTVNGSFTFQLPFNLTDGTTQLVAQVSDNANNKGPLSPVFNVRIITVQGDYFGTGAAQLTIFDPNTESYYVQSGNSFVMYQADPGASYEDIPIQYDTNGDGKTDFIDYQFGTATYKGVTSSGVPVSQQFGLGGVSLPTSGYFQANGTYTLANFGANTAYWFVNLPQPGGYVVKFVVPGLDIPAPAAYQGGGLTEIAVFRPSAVAAPLGSAASDADSFSVGGIGGYFQVSFTNPAVTKLGFVYQAGDIPAPADYDGVGHDEFAIYRPSTGQFFILNTPSDTNTATWTLRTVTMNLPGGPNVNDVPVSEDYDGNGKVDPTVYRPSNSTFYILHSSTGIQQNVPFGLGNFDIAAAGPLKYRLTALKGPYASNGGYPASTTPGKVGVETPTVSSESIASASSSSTSSSAPVASLVAVASPMVLTTTKTTAPTIAVPTPAPTSTVTLASPTIATVPIITAVTPSTSTPASASITIGSSAAKTFVPTVIVSKKETATTTHGIKETKAKKPAVTHKVEAKAAKVEPKTTTTLDAKPVALHPKAKAASTTTKAKTSLFATLKSLVSAKKGNKS